jgi:hypothetical protein
VVDISSFIIHHTQMQTIYTHHMVGCGYEREPLDEFFASHSVLDAAETSDEPCGPFAEKWFELEDNTWCVRVFLRATNEFPTDEQDKILQTMFQEIIGSILY